MCLFSCIVDQIISGLNSRISKVSCQCIQIRIVVVLSSVSKVIRKWLRVFLMNLFRVFRLVIRWVLIDLLLRVLYLFRVICWRCLIRCRWMWQMMFLDSCVNSFVWSMLNISVVFCNRRVVVSIRLMQLNVICQLVGNRWFMKCSVLLFLLSSILFISSGSSKGIGMVQRVVSIVIRLVNNRVFLWCSVS